MPLHIADFIFTITYCPGETNADADGLSHLPLGMEEYMQEEY